MGYFIEASRAQTRGAKVSPNKAQKTLIVRKSPYWAALALPPLAPMAHRNLGNLSRARSGQRFILGSSRRQCETPHMSKAVFD